MPSPRTKTSRRFRASRKLAKAALDKAHPKFRELINAGLMNFYLFSDVPNVNELCDYFLSRLREQGHYKNSHQEQKRRKHISAILLNLYAAFVVGPNRYVAIALNKNEYSDRGRYKPSWISYDITSDLITILEKWAYIERERGFMDRERGVGYLTRIRATRALADQFEKAGLVPDMVSRASEYETIRLKDSDKRLCEYTDDENTAAMRDRVATINAGLDRAFVGLRVSDRVLSNIRKVSPKADATDTDLEWREPVDFINSHLYRVFNDGSFGRGGRFFGGWWQSVPSKLRVHIYVAHEQSYVPKPTREVDFSAMHPSLAYAECGAAPPPDAYHIDGLAETIRQRTRPLLKAAMLRMLNTASQKAAIASLKLWYVDNEVSARLPPAEKVVEMLEVAHPLLKNKGIFYSQVGKKLMFLESQIAEDVMLDLGRQGAVALPVHDSFLVMSGYSNRLVGSMRRSFRERTGFDCDVKNDNTELEQEMHDKGIETIYEGPLEEIMERRERDRAEAAFFWGSFHRWLERQPWYINRPMSVPVGDDEP